MAPLVTPFLTRVLTIILLIQQLMSPGTIPDQAPLTDIAVPVMVTCPVSNESPFNLSDTDREAIRKSNCPDNGPASPESEWRDRLIYYTYNRHDSWPLPDENKTENVLCYDTALTMCMALVLHDYTISVDSLYNEIVDAYGYEMATQGGHTVANGKRTMWPTTIIGYYEEKYGVRSRAIKNADDALDQVKKALLKGHPVVAGDGRPMDFYKNDGSTYHCDGGHTIMFYKYENGIFYAKDRGPGPMVPYPEEGGAIDLRDWMAKNSRGYIGLIEFYVDEEPQPKYPDIEL